MPLTYAELLHTPAVAARIANRVPLGTRVRILGAQAKVDKLYREMTGTIIAYGHPASVFDHLVALDELGENRWFKPSEFTLLEDPIHVDSVDH